MPTKLSAVKAFQFHPFIGPKELSDRPFLIHAARSFNAQRGTGQVPEIAFSIQCTLAQDADTSVMRDLTLGANAYRRGFIEWFKDNPNEQLGPVVISKEVDETKGQNAAGRENWRFKDAQDGAKIPPLGPDEESPF